MGLSFIFGWSWKVRRLRKRWDRLREKTLKKGGLLRSDLLKKLDAIENNLRTLEEQRMNRVMRARISKEVEIDLSEVKALLKTDPEEYREYKEKIAK